MTVAKEDQVRERKGCENVSTQIIMFCKLFGGPLAMPSAHRLGTAALRKAFLFCTSIMREQENVSICPFPSKTHFFKSLIIKI